MKVRSCRCLCALVVLVISSQVSAQDNLLRAVPNWAKVVVVMDLREETESVVTLRKFAKPEQTEALEQLLYGLAQAGLIASGNANLDIQKDVIALFGRRALVAFDPLMDPKQKPAFLGMLEVTDAARVKPLIEKALAQLAGLAPKEFLKSTVVGSATMWQIGPDKESVTLALGPNAIGVSDNADTIKDWLAGADKSGEVGQRARAAFTKVRPGLLNIYIDQTLLDNKAVLGGNPAQEFLKLRSVVASVSYVADGVRHEVAGLVADGSALKKLAATLTEGPPRGFSAVSDDALLAISLASVSSLLAAAPLPLDPASMLALVAGPVFKDIPPAAINTVLQSDLAIALTKLDMPPGVSLALVGKDEADAAQALAAAQTLATRTGVLKTTEETMEGKKILKIHGLPAQAPLEALYAATSGSRIVIATDKTTLSNALSATKNLTSNATFRKVLSGLPRKPLITLYGEPQAIVHKAGIFATQMAGVRNKYLDRAFELFGKAFPFYALSIGVDDDGLRVVSHAGLDFEELRKSSAFLGAAVAAGLVMPVAYRMSEMAAKEASAGVVKAQTEAKPAVAPKPPAPPATKKPVTSTAKKTTKKP